MDHATSFAIAIHTKTVLAEELVFVFLTYYISVFGEPLVLAAVRGQNFESKIFKKMLSLLGIEHRFTTAYRAQSNGANERFNRF